MSKRTIQIGDELRKAIQQVITRGLNDPRIRGLVTITRVRVSEDIRHARVSVSVFPHEHEDLTMHGLRSASRHIRRRAADLVALPRLPELSFVLDQDMKNQAEVIDALVRAREESPSPPNDPSPPEDAPENNP